LPVQGQIETFVFICHSEDRGRHIYSDAKRKAEARITDRASAFTPSKINIRFGHTPPVGSFWTTNRAHWLMAQSVIQRSTQLLGFNWIYKIEKEMSRKIL